METSNYNSLMIPEEINIKLHEYAKLIHDYNKTTNITGLKDIMSIYNELVVGSIKPLMNIDVPRGTSFVDIGTGAGIPGIPLILYFGGNIKGVLIDSNNKKIKFLMDVIDVLGIHDRVTVIQGRAEEMLKEKRYRDSFNFAVARAFAHPLMALEYGLPFIKQGGWMYIYYAVTVNDSDFYDNKGLRRKAGVGIKDGSAGLHKEEDNTGGGDLTGIIQYLQKHSHALGGHMSTREEAIRHKVYEGLLFIKDRPTPNNYPRKHAVVKREVMKLRNV